MTEIYSFQPLSDNLWRIVESASGDGRGVNMYLVIGTQKALLFDAGFGVVDTLRSRIEELTDKPIVCVVGHGHPDHAGAAELFDEVYMNRRDEPLLPVSLSYERRMDDVFSENGPGGPRRVDQELKAYAAEHIVDPGGAHFTYRDMDEGDTVDIGGDRFTVYAIPGHTPGSIALLHESKKYALISDAIGRRIALINTSSEKRVGLEGFKSGLERFKAAIEPETVLYHGHGLEPTPQELIDRLILSAGEILDGKTANDVESQSHFAKRQAAAGKRMTEHRENGVTLVYDANLL